MKQKLLYILLTIVALAASERGWAWGENTSYVLDEPSEQSLFTIATGSAMALSGPGATLTFQAYRQWLAANYFFVEQSTDGGNSWTELANPDLGTSYSSYSFSIETNVTHIRFRTKTGATLRKYYKDVKVTRATTLSTTTTTLVFGNVTKNTTSTLNANIDYNNTTYNQQVTGSCTDNNFTITATTVGATGTGQAVPVLFTPTSVGAHNGMVTLTMNGKTVTFSVSGTSVTTYYTRAEATHSVGGNAYASFTSYDAATAVSDTKNSGTVSVTSATATAFFKAVPSTGYIFKGWTQPGDDYSTGYVLTEAMQKHENYTYDSENASSPTVVGFKAWFAPVVNFTCSALIGSVVGGTADVELAASSVEGTPGTSSGSTTATFTASAREGYKFMGWGTTSTATSYVSTQATYTTTLTNNTPGSTLNTTLYAIFAPNALTLDPASPVYASGFYKTVTLSRTLREGYSTIALPFGTTVAALTGRTSADDWVAQLSTVTYNAQDGYTLYFTKLAKGDDANGGTLAAGQPYVLHLGEEVVDPSWDDLDVPVAEAASVTPATGYGVVASPDGNSDYSDWQMTSNFAAGKSMTGLYGIVNAQGGLQLGSSTSTLNAFTAFIAPPAGNAGVKLRSAFIDGEGSMDYIEGVPFDCENVPNSIAFPVEVYRLDGTRSQQLGRGISILRSPDGTVRKIRLVLNRTK